MSVAVTPSKTKCSHCGALIDFDAGHVPTCCDYCGSPLEAGSTAGGGKADLIAPSVLEESVVRRIAQQWLHRVHDDALPDLGERAHIITADGAYWPFYLFSGVYSGWAESKGTISGGFKELLSGSAELAALKIEAPAYRFFAPPQREVSLEDLSKRIMVELFDELRAAVHVDFCQSVLRFRPEAPLVKFSDAAAEGLPLRTFTIPFEAANQQLKTLLENRARIKDAFFPQLSAQRIYWPFWRVDYLYDRHRYFLLMDGTAGGGEYRGGYKPVDAAKAKLDLRQIADTDPDDIIALFSKHDDDDNQGSALNLTLSVGSSKAKGGCFIATAAYGTELAPEVDALRRYRDEVLLNSAWGRAFVRMYYAVSPALAKLIESKPRLRAIVRALLKPLAEWCRR